MGLSFMVPEPGTTPATPKARRVVGFRRGHASKCSWGQADEVMVTGCEIRMFFHRQHHTTRAQNGRASRRGSSYKPPYGATLFRNGGDLVCLDVNGRSDK